MADRDLTDGAIPGTEPTPEQLRPRRLALIYVRVATVVVSILLFVVLRSSTSTTVALVVALVFLALGEAASFVLAAALRRSLPGGAPPAR